MPDEIGSGNLSPRRSALEPIRSAASKLEDAFSKIDLAKRADGEQTVDPALLAENQHLHGHKFHSQAAGDKPVVYANLGTPGRVDSPVHHHNGEKVIGDVEKGLYVKGTEVSSDTGSNSGSGHPNGHVSSEKVTAFDTVRLFFRRHRWVIILFFGVFFTAWWISIVAQKKHRHQWLIPTVLWILLMARFITFYVPTRPLLEGANWVYQRTFIPVRDSIPQYLWHPIECGITIAVVLIATFATKEYPESTRADRAVSFFGFLAIYFFFFLFSRNKRRINWHTVAMGSLIQFIVALFVLRTKAGFDFFNFISYLAQELLSFANDGVAFLIGDGAKNPIFMVTALPSIIFFIAFIHIWYYWGILQWFVGKFAYIFFWLLQVSGAEAVVAAASPFVGQGESAILVKPFIAHMTDAELYQVMTSGFATISGSMLATYIGLGLNAQALLTSCIMSIPASLAAAKMVYPETEEPLTANHVVVPEDATEEAHNVLHAFSNGAWVGLQIALSIMTNILCIIALVAMIDALLGWFGRFWGIPALTLEQIMGYIFYPVSFLLGVSRDGDIYKVAKLLGTKIIQNEFVAYSALLDLDDISPRSRMLATYGLCGFANLGSMAIQIGVLGQIAPSRKGQVAKMCFSSLLTGAFTTFSSAAVAGMVMADLKRYEK